MRARRKVDAEVVKIGAAFGQPLRTVAGDVGGRAPDASVVIGEQRNPQALTHDADVVLRIVGAVVFSAAPMGELAVIADAHDRRPAGGAAAVSLVIFLAGLTARGDASVVIEPERVTDLV